MFSITWMYLDSVSSALSRSQGGSHPCCMCAHASVTFCVLEGLARTSQLPASEELLPAQRRTAFLEVRFEPLISATCPSIFICTRAYLAMASCPLTGHRHVLGQRKSPDVLRSQQVPRRCARRTLLKCKAAATVVGSPVKQSAGFSVKGTSRKQNEDRYALQACHPGTSYLA
jgi:hypothetical protein